MKTFKFWAFLLLCMATCVNFTACSDNDDNDKDLPSDNVSIIGTWSNVMYDDESGRCETIMVFFKDGSGVISQENEFSPELDFEHPLTWALTVDPVGGVKLKLEGLNADGDENGSWTYPVRITDEYLYTADYSDEEMPEVLVWKRLE